MPEPDMSDSGRQRVGLPPVVFLYTTDQIAGMLNISERALMEKYLYFMGRTSGMKQRHQMSAVNISPENERASWRVSAKELIRWLKRMGFKAYELTYLDMA